MGSGWLLVLASAGAAVASMVSPLPFEQAISRDGHLSERGPGHSARHTLPALCLSAGLAGLSVGIIRPILVDIARAFAISVALAGQLMTAAAVAGLVGNLARAPIVDRINRRTAIIVTLSVMTLAALGSALAPSFSALAIAYAVVGLGGITLVALVIASAGDLYVGPQRGRTLGWILFGNMGVGLVLLPLLSVLADRAGWPAAFYGFSVLAALTTISALVFLPVNLRRQHPERLGYLATLGTVLRNRVAVALLATIAANHASIYGFSTYAGAVAVERFGATTGQTGLVLTARALGMAAAGILVARFFRTSDWRFAAAASIAGAGFGLLGYTTGRSLWWYGVMMLLYGATAGAADIAMIGLLLEAEPERRGAITALRSVMEGVGGITGPATGGAVIAAASYGAAGWLFAGMALVAAAALPLAARWRAGQTSADPRQYSDGGAATSVPDVRPPHV